MLYQKKTVPLHRQIKNNTSMKSYIIKVKTEKLKVNKGLVSDFRKLFETANLVDNVVYHSKEDAINRIRTIVKNKCDKHQYKVSYDNLDRHMHSEMDILISRNNGEVYKIYTLTQIKIN